MPLKLMLDLATIEITFCQLKINVVVHKWHPRKAIYHMSYRFFYKYRCHKQIVEPDHISDLDWVIAVFLPVECLPNPDIILTTILL
jgi:hypothetical protein